MLVCLPHKYFYFILVSSCHKKIKHKKSFFNIFFPPFQLHECKEWNNKYDIISVPKHHFLSKTQFQDQSLHIYLFNYCLVVLWLYPHNLIFSTFPGGFSLKIFGVGKILCWLLISLIKKVKRRGFFFIFFLFQFFNIKKLVIFSPKIIKIYQIVCTRETKVPNFLSKKLQNLLGKKKNTGYSEKYNFLFFIFLWSQVLWELKSTNSIGFQLLLWTLCSMAYRL